jgi:hypothetical protein
MLSTFAYETVVPMSGIISISEVPDDGLDGTHFYGFTLQAVPEPSSVVALCGMGVVSLLALRLRKRCQRRLAA